MFSWDRVDPGSAQLLGLLPPLAGRGADLGCGIGLLCARLLASPEVAELTGDAPSPSVDATAAAQRQKDPPADAADD